LRIGDATLNRTRAASAATLRKRAARECDGDEESQQALRPKLHAFFLLWGDRVFMQSVQTPRPQTKTSEPITTRLQRH
jgi:hypothetical protein